MGVGKFRLSPSMVVAFIALAVAIGGTAYAASKIGTKQIKNNAVTAKKIKKNAVTSSEIKAKAVTTAKLADGAVDGSKVADGSLNGSKMSDYKTLGGGTFLRVVVTAAATEAAARTAAPETVLFTKGPLEIYAKCFRDTGTDTSFGELYVRTTSQGSVMEGNDDHAGGPALTDFLNPDTLEVDRQLFTEQATANDANYNESEGLAAAPDGTGVHILSGIGVKNGVTAIDGPYGAGNACIFQGSVMG